MILLFLVDDHPIVRNGLRATLAAEADLLVVGEASHGQELLEYIPTTPADVVLLDLALPVLDGLATTARLRAEYPALQVLVLTMLADAHRIGRLFAAGARGYLLKSAGQNELVAAIRAVAAGQLYLCSKLGMSLLHQVLALAPAAPAPTPHRPVRRRPHHARAGVIATAGRGPHHQRDCRQALHQQAHCRNPLPAHSKKNPNQEHRLPHPPGRDAGPAGLGFTRPQRRVR